MLAWPDYVNVPTGKSVPWDKQTQVSHSRFWEETKGKWKTEVPAITLVQWDDRDTHEYGNPVE